VMCGDVWEHFGLGLGAKFSYSMICGALQ